MATELAVFFIIGFGFLVLISLVIAGWGQTNDTPDPTAD